VDQFYRKRKMRNLDKLFQGKHKLLKLLKKTRKSK